jgi:hypothetical protein
MEDFYIMWSIVAVASVYTSTLRTEKDCWYYFVAGMTLTNIFFLSVISICIFQLYLTPLGELSSVEEGPIADKLVECIVDIFPELSLEFSSIADCLHDVNMYMVRKGRLPFHGGRWHGVPTAFVMTKDSTSVFVTKYYTDLNVYNRALVMIHECAHLGLDAEDYAYLWEESFNNLTVHQHSKNADSFMKLVSDYC